MCIKTQFSFNYIIQDMIFFYPFYIVFQELCQLAAVAAAAAAIESTIDQLQEINSDLSMMEVLH